MKKPAPTPIKTILTIVLGFLVIHIVTKNNWILIAALVLGVLGLFSPYFAKKIDFLWMKLSIILSWIVPNIVLSLIFFLFLFPIALLSRIFSKKSNLLKLKNNSNSMFTNRTDVFSKTSFEKPW